MTDLYRSDEMMSARRRPRGRSRRALWFAGWILLNFVAGVAISHFTQQTGERPGMVVAGGMSTRPIAGEAADLRAHDPAAADGLPLAREDCVKQAEELFLSGAYEEAGRVYDALLNDPAEPANPALQYQRALCWEMMGEFDQAVELYRKLADDHANSAILACSQLGQARSWIGQDRISPARSLLLALILNSARHPEVAADAFHTLAQVATLETFPADIDLLSDKSIVPAIPLPQPARLAKLLTTSDAAVSPAEMKTEVRLVDQFSPDPRDIRVSLRAAGAPLTEVLEKVVEVTQLEINSDSRVRGMLQSRSVDLDVADLDLATVLDGVLEPVGLSWQHADGSIQLELSADPVAGAPQPERADRAERFCREALASHPDHPLAWGTQSALGNIRFEQQAYEDAVSVYQSVLRRSEDKQVNVCTWFNLGKAYLLQKQYEPSRQAFFKVADLASGQSLQPIVYLYLGRLLLEDGQTEQAIRQFVRAQSLAQDSEIRCRSTMALAGAYLLAGNPQAANMTLMAHRDVLKSSSHEQAEAAFLAALARFRGTADPTERMRRGRTLVSAVAHVEPGRSFGFAGYLLLGQAHDELGLPSQMKDVYREALQVAPQHFLRDRVQYELAMHLAENREWSQAQELLQGLVDESSSRWSRQARFALAEVALQQEQIEDCLRWCYELVDTSMSGSEKQQLLKMMGQAYERQADHLKAALCFAGLVPVPVATE